MKYKNVLLLGAVTLLVTSPILVACACGTTPTTPTTTAPTTTMVTETKSLDILVQSVDPDVGIQVLLIPKDENGLSFETEGNISAKLWLQEENDIEPTKGQLLLEWNDIYVTKQDYTPFMGLKIPLVWDEFYHQGYCALDVTLTMPDGAALSGEIIDIIPSIFEAC
ncbi:MAG: hypothetical protein ABH934_04685 [Chloroflexota bacterium]